MYIKSFDIGITQKKTWQRVVMGSIAQVQIPTPPYLQAHNFHWHVAGQSHDF